MRFIKGLQKFLCFWLPITPVSTCRSDLLRRPVCEILLPGPPHLEPSPAPARVFPLCSPSPPLPAIASGRKAWERVYFLSLEDTAVNASSECSGTHTSSFVPLGLVLLPSLFLYQTIATDSFFFFFNFKVVQSSGFSCIFRVVHHHHYPLPGHFHSLRRNLTPSAVTSLLSSSSPWQSIIYSPSL